MRFAPLVLAVLAAPVAALAQQPPEAAAPAQSLQATPPAATPAPAPVVVPEAPAAPAAAKKHGIFPLWGDAVRAKGFDLPNPFSVMVNYYYQSSELTINNLQLGFNGGPMRNYDQLIQIPSARAKGQAVSIRPAIMVFPFLTFYGVFSKGTSRTDVSVAVPALNSAFDTTVESDVKVVALGATAQMGYKGVFGVADFNAAVSDVARLSDLVGAGMLSFRLGYAHKLHHEGEKIAGWVGTAGQVIDLETSGQVRLSSVVPPGFVPPDCSTLPPAQRPLCQGLTGALANGTVEYSLDKKPKNVWNLLIGAQYAFDRNWAFRTEVSFLGGRYSLFAGTAYEFDIL